jgi:peroxiredoxin
LERRIFGEDDVRDAGRDARLALGLAVDATAPPFSLNDLDGNPVSLHGLLAQGRSVVALFMDPDCDACSAMLPDVERWQQALRPGTDLIIISRGAIERNIEKFGNRPIRHVLLERAGEVSHAFRCPGTPAAVWISADGRIASSLVMGPAGIRTLVKAIYADNSAPSGVRLESPALSVQ